METKKMADGKTSMVEVMEFNLVDNKELALQKVQTEQETTKLRATQKEAEEEIERKKELLYAQRIAIEESTYEQIRRIWDRGLLRDYCKQVELKAKLEKEVKELAIKFGEFDYKITPSGKVVILFDEVVVEFGYLMVFNKGKLSFSIYGVDTKEKVNAIVEFLKTQYEAQIEEKLNKYAGANFTIVERKTIGKKLVVLLKSNDNYWVVTTFEAGIRLQDGTPEVDLRNQDYKNYEGEKRARNKFIEWGGN